MASDELDALRKAVEGLLYPSESDEPFDVFVWKGSSDDPARAVAAHVPRRANVQEQPFNAFFDELKESDDAERFDHLQQVLKSSIANPRIYRAGAVEVDVFIVGKLRTGDWAGVHTRSIET